MSKELVRDITTEEAIELIEKIIEYYKANARPRQRLGVMIQEMGFAEFKSGALGD